MKTAYIIPLFFLSTLMYAQENKQSASAEDQTQVLKQIKEHETKLMQDAKERIENKQFIQNLLLTRAGSEKQEQNLNQPIPQDCFFPIQQH
jgi:hypothetical protein